ncbi:replication protein [Bacillus haynesii]|uniref:replication protein n=1 Tax=Bacillus haynesii TaxID=1925021 RepID=UPI00227E7283|nr:replication protein [Bacillus haynesii]MCY9153679.1 replication protein [Bacillus haynesii]MEC0719686.1 replication protein [Bacillus haynesii]
MSGWIKLHRKIKENPIFANSDMFKLWALCLIKATHKEHDQLVGNQMVKLLPGEFVTGRHELASEFNEGVKPSEKVSSSTVWRYMKNFEKWQMLNIKSGNKFSVISITNWSEYQQNEQQVNSKWTASEQQVNTNKNVKNDKNEKNNNKRLVFDESHMKLAALLWKCIQAHSPNLKKPNLDKWANTFRLMMERDGREGKEIQGMIVWSTNHHFWYQNILSPDKLRKQYDRLAVQKNEEERKEWRNGSQQHGQSFGGNIEEASGKVSPIFGNRVGRLRKKG